MSEHALGLSGPIPRIAAVGCGHWGRNIVRNLSELKALSAVCDINPTVAREFSDKYGVPFRTLTEILEGDDCDGVALASPASLHVEHTTAALHAGRHVFVEKPLALNAPEGHILADLALETRRVLMVGHLLQYHPLMVKLFELVRDGRLGEIKHISSNRLNVGRVRDEENVLWSLAPHDISVILAIMGEVPTCVSAHGVSIVNPNIADIANVSLEFASGVSSRICVSWLSPYKEQRLTVIGTKASIVFDDGAEWKDKLVVYDRRSASNGGRPWKKWDDAERVSVVQREPLKEECAHFLSSIMTGSTPRTGAAEALRVLAVLDGATKALQTGRSEAIL